MIVNTTFVDGSFVIIEPVLFTIVARVRLSMFENHPIMEMPEFKHFKPLSHSGD